MNRYDSQLARFWIRREKETSGQLLLSGAGRAGEAPTEVLWAQQHGFASRPPVGAQAWIQQMAGRPSQMVAFGGEHPEMRPQMDPGNAVLYDHQGKIIKIFDDGMVIDAKDKTIEIKSGGWTFNGTAKIKGNLTIEGDVRIEGNLHVTGNITTDGTNPNAHSH